MASEATHSGVRVRVRVRVKSQSEERGERERRRFMKGREPLLIKAKISTKITGMMPVPPALTEEKREGERRETRRERERERERERRGLATILRLETSCEQI